MGTKKSEQTIQYILKQTAPIFNKNGYEGTSMSDITKATGLTKGAIYGNFKNKEELSLMAFNFNIKHTIGKLGKELEYTKSPIAKLYCITNFFRRYHQLTIDYGGCPLLNIGVDSRFKNSVLLKRVKSVINKLENNIAGIISMGMELGEIKPHIDPQEYAALLFSMIEGSIFMTVVLKDPKYIDISSNQIDKIIRTELSL